MDSFGVIVLAAGQARRFGSQKLLYPLRMDSQRPAQAMLGWTVEIIKQVTDQLIVVVDAEQPGLVEYVESLGVRYVINPSAYLGLGRSLACGIQQITEQWAAAMIALGDMPFIQPESLKRLKEKALPNAIIVPQVRLPDGSVKQGNPVVFGRSFFEELSQLDQDQGGKDLIVRHQAAVILEEFDDTGLLQDIDQPDDLVNIIAQ